MKSKKTSNRSTQRKRQTASRTRGQSPNLAGDVPKRQPVDQSTSSVAPPRATGQITFRQLAPLATLSVAAGVAGASTITFALNGINGASTLATLFDLYRIDAIRMTIRPNNNAIGMVDPSSTYLVPLYWVIDYNDATALATANQALEYDNCMIVTPGESGERTFRPMYSLPAKSAAGTDYISRSGDWLACSSDDILHYGCKFYIPAGSGAQTFLQTWTVEVEYFLTFRQVS